MKSTFVHFIYLIFAVIRISGGDYSITYAPEWVKFVRTTSPLPLHELNHIILSSFGYETKQDIIWSGLGAGNPFQRPKAQVLVSIEMPDGLTLTTSSAAKYSYSSYNDVGELSTKAVGDYLQAFTEKPLIVDFSDDNALQKLREELPGLTKHIPSTLSQFKDKLNTTFPEVESLSINNGEQTALKFIVNLFVCKMVVKNMESSVSGNSPDFVHLKVSTLPSLAAKYGQQSKQIAEALEMLQNLIVQVTTDIRSIFKDSVIVHVVQYNQVGDVVDKQMRHLLDYTNTTFADQYKPFQNYLGEEYTTIFSIIFWGLLVLGFGFLIISSFIWFMDPGRDSIIYRMTSQRLKTD